MSWGYIGSYYNGSALRGVYMSRDYIGLYYKSLGIKRCVHVKGLHWIVLHELGYIKGVYMLRDLLCQETRVVSSLHI